MSSSVPMTSALERRHPARTVRPPRPAGSTAPGLVPAGGELVAWREVAGRIREANELVDGHLADVVLTARAEGLSWDRISAALGGVPTGQTLCRVFGAEARRRAA